MTKAEGQDLKRFGQELSGGFNWQRMLFDCITCTGINPFLHVLVSCAHLYALSSKSSSDSQQRPSETTTQEKDEQNQHTPVDFSTILSMDPATMLYEFASILMQERTTVPPNTCSQSSQSTEQPNQHKEAAAKRDMNLIAIQHLTCILSMLFMLASLAVLLSFSAKGRRTVPGFKNCTIRRMVMDTFGVQFFATLTACTCMMWAASIIVSELPIIMDYKLAVCMSMHSAMIVLGWAMEVLYCCPFPMDIFMPVQLAGCTAASAGLLLFITGHFYNNLIYSTEEFYRNHAVSVFLICPLLRQTVLRLVGMACLV